jgi:hypothetical protein
MTSYDPTRPLSGGAQSLDERNGALVETDDPQECGDCAAVVGAGRAPWGGVSLDRVRELCVSGLVF